MKRERRADDEEMSRAEWLASEEVVVTPATTRDGPLAGDLKAFLAEAGDDMNDHWTRFEATAGAQGYRSDEAGLLYRTIPRVRLDAATATGWMYEGFTPWAARVWIDAGLDNAAEAHEYSRWRVTAEEAFWIRRDGLSQVELRARREVVEWMARSLLGNPTDRRRDDDAIHPV